MENNPPLHGELIQNEDDQVQRSIAELHQVPVMYTHISPADESLRLKRTPSAKRTYLSRLNEAAKLWGFTLNHPEFLGLRERQARERERYKLVPWHGLRRHHVTALLERLRNWPLPTKTETDPPKYRSAQTINVTLAAVKDVARQAFLLEQISADDFKRIELIKGDRVNRQPVGRYLPIGEIRAIMVACEDDQSPAGCRDAAIIGLLYTGGLRRFEVAGLRVEQLDIDEGEITLIGKGNKQRKTWPDAGTWTAIKEWLGHRGNHDGPLIQPVNKSGKIVASGCISNQSIYDAVVKRVEQAALSLDASPHDFRRSFITTLLDNNTDVIKTRDLAGHNSTDTTALYDRRPEQELKKAQEVLHLPYSGITRKSDERP
jgi:integrase/recombinase XerD